MRDCLDVAHLLGSHQDPKRVDDLLLHLIAIKLFQQEVECGVFHDFFFLGETVGAEVVGLELHVLLEDLETYCGYLFDLLGLLFL